MIGKESLGTVMGESCRFRPSKQIVFLRAIHARCVFMFVEIVYPCLPFGHFEIIIAMCILCNVGDAIFIHVVANEVDSRISETVSSIFPSVVALESNV